MSDYWSSHQGAVAAAIEKIADLQQALAVCTDSAETAIGLVLESVGATEHESARNALDLISGAKERVNEAYGMSMQAKAELERYRGGF